MEIAAFKTKALGNVLSLSGEMERTGNNVNAVAVVNALNRINFQGGHVSVRLRHVWNNSFINVAAKPEAGDGCGIKLSWDDSARPLLKDISAHEYSGLFYSDGLKMVWVRAVPISMSNLGITLAAPEGGDEVSERNFRRYRCREIATKLTQGRIILRGTMKDYSAAAFAMTVSGEQIAEARQINTDLPVKLVLADGEEVLFKATCRIVRASTPDPEITLVLAPVPTNIRTFTKQFRSTRQVLTPQPCIEFRHPFLGKKISLKAVDVSGAGISVEEDSVNSVLMPGMVIPEMAITFANSFKIHCRAQVLHNRSEEGGEVVHVGLVFTEMNCENQLQLASILFQAQNERSYVGNGIDQDELWDFFFETGFVYPQKYMSIVEQKGEFKKLYTKLYNDCPDIARHVVYRDKGVINGHVSMFRYYRRTWLLHHHAAIKSSRHKAGLVVMDHILQHINDVHRFADASMEYIACYFRPNNRFASRVFGGASRSLQDPRKSSLDEFAYFHHDDRSASQLSDDWALTQSSREDFDRLKSYYEEISGGLMLDSLDLDKEALDKEEINSSYRERGLKRERKFYSLRNNDGRLAAMFILNFSDVGLNMSSLTDCIQVMVIDQEKVGTDKITSALGDLSEHFKGKVPVLLFPRRYADGNGLAYENVYTLGVLNLKYISKFMGFMAGLTKKHPLRLAKK